MKYVYSFGSGRTEGSGERNALLGGKGAGLAEMSHLGIPVPPGFTLTTEVCREFSGRGSYPEGLEREVDEHLARLEEVQGLGFGSAEDPLLVSVRSGAIVSMPGMMDTVLNLGLNRDIVDACATRTPELERFYLDCFRRLLVMYADVVLDVPHAAYEECLRELELGREDDGSLSVDQLRRLVTAFEEVLEERGTPFPQDPRDQLWGAIGAVFRSWDNQRAREYRRIQQISSDLGTAVNVQAMVFGNRGDDCATGVAFSRNPSSGELELYGEYLVNAQGEDVVAGTHTPHPIGSDGDRGGMRERFPDAYDKLEEVCGILERHFRNMQDLEFTIQHGRLFMLQTRAGKRSGPAAVRIAVDMVRERLIDRREALRRVEPQHLVQVMAPVFDLAERRDAIQSGRRIGVGLAAGPGAASGRVALTAAAATEMASGGPVLLVRNETSPEDIVGMHASVGILTTRGGMTSHAAVVARGLGKPCVVGAAELLVDDEERVVRAGDVTVREGDELSIDGTSGDVLVGRLETRPSEVLEALFPEGEAPPERGPIVDCFERLLEWADRERRLRVRANADTPQDAQVARVFGAEGVGLCRTEHMFFAEDRIPWVRQLIVASDDSKREAALRELEEMQRADFEGIFETLAGLPVTVRLLDPPLHEFLPHTRSAIEELASLMEMPAELVLDKVATLEEVNPMLGHRGCRLGLTKPEIYRMQTRALVRAACEVTKRGGRVAAEVMIPLVGVEEELRRLRELVEEVAAVVQEEEGTSLPLLIGTMIEVPRAALLANRIALHADFFSFGTNDLTQMTYGYSRDDVGHFLPSYVEQGIVASDPFEHLDADGVGQLVEIASRRGRMAAPELKLGVCGEHGGDPQSIEFFERCGLDYVSCSPYRLPIARLAAARAHLAFGPGGFAEGLEHPLDE